MCVCVCVCMCVCVCVCLYQMWIRTYSHAHIYTHAMHTTHWKEKTFALQWQKVCFIPEDLWYKSRQFTLCESEKDINAVLEFIRKDSPQRHFVWVFVCVSCLFFFLFSFYFFFDSLSLYGILSHFDLIKLHRIGR